MATCIRMYGVYVTNSRPHGSVNRRKSKGSLRKLCLDPVPKPVIPKRLLIPKLSARMRVRLN